MSDDLIPLIDTTMERHELMAYQQEELRLLQLYNWVEENQDWLFRLQREENNEKRSAKVNSKISHNC